jgi:hypothetical protein
MFEIKHLYRRITFLLAVFSALMVLLFASRDTTEAATNLYTFYPTANTAYTSNPGMGWQFGDGNTTELLPESTMYAQRSDISWRILNPSSGVYDWTVLDRYLQEAIAQQKQLSFRVYTMRGEGWGGHEMPQWVVSAGAVILSDGSPDYSNCTYQHEWTRFVNALRLRYDGVRDIAFIDISGYGNFNEWSWTDGQTTFENNPNSPTTLDGKARNRLAFAFIGGADSQHQCRNAQGVTQTVPYSYTGFQQTQLVMPYAGIRQMTAIVAARRPDIGIRYDCLGRIGSGTNTTDGLMARIGQQIEATWRNAPIMYEFCGGVTGESTYMTESDILLRASHGAMVHDTLRDPRDANRVNTLMMNVGYRYKLDYARFFTTVASGDNFTVEMVWRNIGYAPSYPRMGQNFEMHVYLVNAQGNTVVNALIDSQIHTWMPAHPLPGTAPSNTVYDVFTMPSLPAGDYSLRVAIVETRTSRPINVAINGRDTAGRYTLGTVRITSATAPTATITNTPAPTMTRTPIATMTSTAAPTMTRTPMPTMTNTPLPTMTSTTVPPTKTPMPLPTMTSTPFTIPTATPNTGGAIGASPTPIPPLPTNPPAAGASPTPIPPIGATAVLPMPTATLAPGLPSGGSAQIHIGDVDGWKTDSRGRRWSVLAEVRVHDSNEQPVANATVTGIWSLDNSIVTCVTDGRGRCSVYKESIDRDTETITFTVTNVSHPSFTYAAHANHDPYGGTPGAVTIWR